METSIDLLSLSTQTFIFCWGRGYRQTFTVFSFLSRVAHCILSNKDYCSYIFFLCELHNFAPILFQKNSTKFNHATCMNYNLRWVGLGFSAWLVVWLVFWGCFGFIILGIFSLVLIFFSFFFVWFVVLFGVFCCCFVFLIEFWGGFWCVLVLFFQNTCIRCLTWTTEEGYKCENFQCRGGNRLMMRKKEINQKDGFQVEYWSKTWNKRMLLWYLSLYMCCICVKNKIVVGK